MPAAAYVGTLGLQGGALFFSVLAANIIDAYILGAILAPSSNEDLGSQNLVVRSASESHKIVYGRTMVGGTAVFLDVLDRYYLKYESDLSGGRITEQKESGGYLNLAVAIAAHEIDGIEEVYIGEDLVFKLDVVNGLLKLVDNKYKDKIEFIGYRGNQTTGDNFILANVDKQYDAGSISDSSNLKYYEPYGVTAISPTSITIDETKVFSNHSKFKMGGGVVNIDGSIVFDPERYSDTLPFVPYSGSGRTEPVEGRQWSTDHILTNTAYVYLRFKYDPELYSGIPKVRCVIRGKRVFDPRQSEANFTLNDRGNWSGNTAYAVDDKVTSASGKTYRCIKAHTAGIFLSFLQAFLGDVILGQNWATLQSETDSSTWEYSDNWALCLRDYLSSGNYYGRIGNSDNSLYGIGVKSSEISNSNIIEAANVADEIVNLTGSTLSAIDGPYSTNTNVKTLYVTGDQTDYYVKYEEIIIGGSTTNLVYTRIGETVINGEPTPLLDTNTEEVISKARYYIEDSYYEANNTRTVITFKVEQDFTVTNIRIQSPRYTINGIVDTAQSPISNLENLLAAGAGTLPYVQGKFLAIPGAYNTPTFTIDESNLAGDVTVDGSAGSANLINTVSGTIKNPANKWEESDFPKQTHSNYILEDGGYELLHSVKYPFTTSNFDAQRLARISLQRARLGVSATLICNLSVMEIPVGSFIKVNIDRLGWSDTNGNNIFSVTSWSLQDSKIVLKIRQEGSSAYVWDKTTLEPIKYSPTTSYSSSPDLSPVSALTITSDNSTLYKTGDGTVLPQAKVTWTAPTQETRTLLELVINITSGVSANETRTVTLNPSDEQYFIRDVKDQDLVSVAATIKYTDPNIENSNIYTTVSASGTVVGKSAAPNPVTGLNVTSGLDGQIKISWTNPTDLDFKHTTIYSANVNNWNDASKKVIGTTSGTTLTDVDNQYATMYYWAIAEDTTGNVSVRTPNAITGVSGTQNLVDAQASANTAEANAKAYTDNVVKTLADNAYAGTDNASVYATLDKAPFLMFQVVNNNTWPDTYGGVVTHWYASNRATQVFYLAAISAANESEEWTREVNPTSYPTWSAWKKKEIYSNSDIDVLQTINAPSEAGATAGSTWNSNISGQPSDTTVLNTNQQWSDVINSSEILKRYNGNDLATANREYYISCQVDNNHNANGWYKVASFTLVNNWTSWSFNGTANLGSSTGRYTNSARVSISGVVTSGSPLGIGSSVFSVSVDNQTQFDARFKVYREAIGNPINSYKWTIYAYTTNYTSVRLEGIWRKGTGSTAWINDNQTVGNSLGTTYSPVGILLTPNFNYEPQATVGAQSGVNIKNYGGTVVGDTQLLNANTTPADIGYTGALNATQNQSDAQTQQDITTARTIAMANATGANLLNTGTFTDSLFKGDWTSGSVVAISSVAGVSALDGYTHALKLTQRDNYDQTNRIPVTPGETMYWACWINTQATTQLTQFGYRQWIGGVAQNLWPYAVNLAAGNDWTYLTGELVIASGTTSIAPFLQINSFNTFGEPLVQGLVISRTNPNADITASNIAAGIAGQGKLALLNQVDNTQIANGTITDAQIGSLSADKITAGTLTARTVQTKSTGQRMVLNSTTNEAEFYDSNNYKVATIGINLGYGTDNTVLKLGSSLATTGKYQAIHAESNGPTYTIRAQNYKSGYSSAIIGYGYVRGVEGGTNGNSKGAIGVTAFASTAEGVPLYIEPSIASYKPAGAYEGSMWVPSDGNSMHAYLSSRWNEFSVTRAKSIGSSTQGYKHFNDGLLIIWGTFASNTVNNQTVSYHSGLTFTTPFLTMAIPNDSSISDAVGIHVHYITTSNFVVHRDISMSANTARYIAWGYKA